MRMLMVCMPGDFDPSNQHGPPSSESNQYGPKFTHYSFKSATLLAVNLLVKAQNIVGR